MKMMFGGLSIAFLVHEGNRPQSQVINIAEVRKLIQGMGIIFKLAKLQNLTRSYYLERLHIDKTNIYEKTVYLYY